MKHDDLKSFVGFSVEAVIMGSRMVLKGTLEELQDGFAKFSKIEDLFVLVHGKRLSLRLMLSGSFIDLEALLKNLCFPCSLFDTCKKIMKNV
jgi:hypothetical protein